jgi:tricorn protease
VAFVDNGRKLYVTEIATGKTTKIGEDVNFFPGVFRELFGSWSADGNNIAYTTITETNFEKAWVYSLTENKSHALTDALSNVTEPVFDPSGKYIYLLASTDAGPVVNWFDQSANDMESTDLIYLITLQKETLSPFAKENEIEEVKDTTVAKPKDTASLKSKLVKIDWDGIQNRIVPLPIAKGNYRSLQIPKEGELYYLSDVPHGASPTMLKKYDLKKRKEEPIMPANGFIIAAKGEKMLYNSNGKWGIVATGQKPGADALLNTSLLQVKIKPMMPDR